MDAKKKKKPEAAGFAVGDAQDFLKLSDAEMEYIRIKRSLAKTLEQPSILNLFGPCASTGCGSGLCQARPRGCPCRRPNGPEPFRIGRWSRFSGGVERGGGKM